MPLNTEFEPFAPTPELPEPAPPPAPTVTEYEPAEILCLDSALEEPPEAWPTTEERYPPAPPPPA